MKRFALIVAADHSVRICFAYVKQISLQVQFRSAVYHNRTFEKHYFIGCALRVIFYTVTACGRGVDLFCRHVDAVSENINYDRFDLHPLSVNNRKLRKQIKFLA